jgi:hypothetical protein
VLARAVERALTSTRRQGRSHPSRRAAARTVDVFRQRLAVVEAIDFFASAGRDRVVLLISELQRTLSSVGGTRSSPRTEDPYVRRTWVTRPRPGIDRMGSAWLIKRFVDSEARFDFVDQPPTKGNALPFDMFGVEFTHRGEWCTFETLQQTFAIEDAAVDRLAAIVHDLDFKDGRFGPPEAPAVGRIVEGLQILHADDHTLLQQGMTVFEALYRSFERAARPTGPRRVSKRRRPDSPGTRKRS